jgi:hypothetical protein
MNYLVCETCRFETRDVTEACKQCGAAYVCEWDPAWYANPFTLASMGRSERARSLGNAYATFIALFAAYVIGVFAYSGASRDAWNAAWGPFLLLSFCTYEVWAFTRGQGTTIDRFSHEGIPKNTELRVFGLCLDVAGCVWAAYMIIANDA